jgi:hypothetical protein
VKCDESRPGCLRCQKAGFVCDGYPLPKRASRIAATSHKSIGILQNPATHKVKLPLNLTWPTQTLNTGLFTEAEVDSRYVDYFLHKTSTGFEGMMDWTVWNYVVMQFSHHQPFVRDCIVGIGALIKSLDTADATKELSGHPIGMAKIHREFAMRKYAKALKTMQTVLEPSSEPRQILISCLLVFSFEMLLENRHAAISHFVSGHRLLRQVLKKDVLVKRKLEDELVESFEHLDLQVGTVYDKRPIEFHKSIVDEGYEAVQNMPATFNDLIEARRYLNLITGRCHHFMAIHWEATDAAAYCREFSVKSPGRVDVVSGSNVFSTTCIVPDTLPAEHGSYVNDLSRWSQGFTPVFKLSRSPGIVGSRKYLMATHMQIHALAMKIILAGVLFTKQCSYDKFLPEFQEMLDLIHIVFDTYQKRGQKSSPGDTALALDLGLTPPLFLILIRCRARTIRRHAIAILRRWPVQLCWNPRLIAEIGLFFIEVEEEGCLEGPIPETSRAVITRVCEAPIIRDGQNEALIQLFQPHGGPDGEPVWKEKTVVYNLV